MNWQRTTCFKVAILLIVLLAGLPAERIRAQEVLPPYTMESKLAFAIDSLCVVSDPAGSLASFFDALDKLSAGKDTVVSIVHLGDSHIQAGSYSGRVMRLLQRQFGNAGRGWVAPLKITRTNEPDDYFISTVVKEWETGRCVQRLPHGAIGPGGIGLRTVSPFVNFDIRIAPANGAGYSFDRVIVYRGGQSMPMLPAGALRDSAEVLTGADMKEVNMIADTIRLSHLTDSLQLQSTRRKPGTDLLLPAESFNNLYYGFTLANGQAGILYHSIGINGAMFVNFTDEQYIRQLATFQPSLLILSLGTNESFGRGFSAEVFTEQTESLLSLIKKHMPRTAILITTPPECFKRISVNKKRQYVRNENTERIAKTLVNIAVKEGIACWDLFQATGGKNSSKAWYEGKWMGRDRVHFNKEGYQEQGILLFNALMKRKTENQ